MELMIESVDYAPEELYEQCPIIVELIRELPGPDRPDYWLGKPKAPIRWLKENTERYITYLILAARWEGTRIEPKAKNLPVGIAYVVDESLLNDSKLTFEKCSYVAIGLSHVDGAVGSALGPGTFLSGTIGKFFGTGNQS
jgi:hypothetical protein